MPKPEPITPRRKRRERLPDIVIFVRVAMAFVVLGLFSLPSPYPVVALVLIAFSIALDGLDGYLARRLGVASELGGILDITGDRIVEHVFWIYFAVSGLVPLWVPLLIVSRSFIVDAIRTVAFFAGRTAFGNKTMQRSALSRFLVASRFMRNAYGVAKVTSFLLLGLLVVLDRAGDADAGLVWLAPLTQWVVFLTVAICVVRAVPVMWDARSYFKPSQKSAPPPHPQPSPGGTR